MAVSNPARKENRKDFTFRRQFNQKLHITPGCPGSILQNALITRSVESKRSVLLLFSVFLFFGCVQCISSADALEQAVHSPVTSVWSSWLA